MTATYNIPEANFSSFVARIEKLNKRARKLNVEPIVYTVNAEKMVKYVAENHGVRRDVMMKVFDVSLDIPEIKLGGWSFVATIDHTEETGNIVRVSPSFGGVLSAELRTCAPNCAHCRTQRMRSETFIVQNVITKEIKQIGRSCLKDFLGHDVVGFLARCEMIALASEAAEESESYGMGGGGLEYYTLVEYVACVLRVVDAKGWRSRSAAIPELGEFASADDAATMMFGMKSRKIAPLSDEFYVRSEEVIEWAREYLETEDSDFAHNVRVVIKSDYVKSKNFGFAACVVMLWNKNKVAQQDQAVSTFIGEVGKPIDGQAVVSKFLTFEGVYGRTYCYLLTTSEGNVIKYTSSKGLDVIVGDTVKFSSKVKDHSEYRGIKQTVIGGRYKTAITKI